MRVGKWGSSLAVRLPRALVEELGLQLGDRVDLVAASPARIEVQRRSPKDDAAAALASLGWALPSGYRFDRDSANKR